MGDNKNQEIDKRNIRLISQVAVAFAEQHNSVNFFFVIIKQINYFQ